MNKIFVLLIALYCFNLCNSSSAQDLGQSILYVTTRDINGTERVVLTTRGHQDYLKTNTDLAKKMKNVPGVLSPNSLPKALQVRSLQLLTPKGRLNVKIVEARLEIGASEAGIVLVTDLKGRYPEFFGSLAKIGKPFPTAVQLKSITESGDGIAGDDPRVSKLAATFQKWMEQRLSEYRRKFYQTVRIEPSDFRFVEGAFRPGGGWLVWGALNETQERQDLFSKLAGEISFKVGAILNAEGIPIEVLEEPALGAGDGLSGSSPIFTFDSNADGYQDLVCNVSHYDGGEVVYYRWNGARMVRTVLEGDSA